MKGLRNPSVCDRENLCLLASGSLLAPEASALEEHLAGCNDCRRYFEEVKAITAPLLGWEQYYTDVELDPVVQQRWIQGIETVTALPTGSTDRSLMIIVLFKAWSELIWPVRRVWSGLAGVWLALALFQFMLDGGPMTRVAQSSVAAAKARQAFQDQHRLLAEILGPPPVVTPTEPLRHRPQPRSEKPNGWRTAAASQEMASVNSLWS